MNDTLTHELVHAYDYCRVNIDWNNLEHLACTEARVLVTALAVCSSVSSCTRTHLRMQPMPQTNVAHPHTHIPTQLHDDTTHTHTTYTHTHIQSYNVQHRSGLRALVESASSGKKHLQGLSLVGRHTIRFARDTKGCGHVVMEITYPIVLSCFVGVCTREGHQVHLVCQEHH